MDKKGINKKCLEGIERINKRLNPQFRDFVSLKTYGMDKYSKMNLESLIRATDLIVVNMVTNEFHRDNKSIACALRWYNRGLKVYYSIAKVKTDLTIESSIKEKIEKMKKVI